MKAYIDQIFYEGLGRSVYVPIENKINKIKNNTLKKVIIYIIKIIYIAFTLFIMSVILYFV